MSEGARKERFEEAVRTENVALRLRAGVIAEVGPGVPATVVGDTGEGARKPELCRPEQGTLACARIAAEGPQNTRNRLRDETIREVGPAGAATTTTTTVPAPRP